MYDRKDILPVLWQKTRERESMMCSSLYGFGCSGETQGDSPSRDLSIISAANIKISIDIPSAVFHLLLWRAELSLINLKGKVCTFLIFFFTFPEDS